MLLRLICGLKLNEVSCDTPNFHNTTVPYTTAKVYCSTKPHIFHNKKVYCNKKKSNDNCFKIIHGLPNLLTFFRKSKKKRTIESICIKVHKLFEMLNKNYNPYYLNLIFCHTHLIIEFVIFEYLLDQNIVLELLLN